MKATTIQEFKDLVFKRYGLVLSDTEALEQAGNLLRLYTTVYGTHWIKTPNTDENQKIS